MPLSIKEIGVSRNIEKIESGNYLFKEVEVTWYSFGNNFIKISQGPVYVYSSIFAPTDLKTEISYQWSKFNEGTNRWEDYNKINHSIKGGRASEYKGYVYASNLCKGK